MNTKCPYSKNVVCSYLETDNLKMIHPCADCSHYDNWYNNLTPKREGVIFLIVIIIGIAIVILGLIYGAAQIFGK
jgi:hypothetical protein